MLLGSSCRIHGVVYNASIDSKIAEANSFLVVHDLWFSSSRCSVLKNDSIMALSYADPTRPIEPSRTGIMEPVAHGHPGLPSLSAFADKSRHPENLGGVILRADDVDDDGNTQHGPY